MPTLFKRHMNFHRFFFMVILSTKPWYVLQRFWVGDRWTCHWRCFLGLTYCCTTNLRIWSFFDQETYIQFVAQETRIIWKFSPKNVKSTMQKWYFYWNYCNYVIIKLVYFWLSNFDCRFRSFLVNKLKLNNFLTMLISWATKWV